MDDNGVIEYYCNILDYEVCSRPSSHPFDHREVRKGDRERQGLVGFCLGTFDKILQQSRIEEHVAVHTYAV